MSECLGLCLCVFPHAWVCIYLYICICLWMFACVCTWPVYERVDLPVPLCISFWVSVWGCYYMYLHVFGDQWLQWDFRHLSNAWQAKGEIWCWRMVGQALCSDSSGSTTIFFHDEVCSTFQGPLLAASSTSRPPGSPLSPFLMDLMSRGEFLEVHWDFKREIQKETSPFPPHSPHFPFLTFINAEHEAQGSQPFCIF